MILDVGNCRARHLFAHVERAVWKELGYRIFGWVGPVAEPVPKKLRGSAGTVPAVAATSPRTRLLTRCPAAREQAFTYPVEDAATGPGDEDW